MRKEAFSKMGQAAMAYAQRLNLPVFPCKPGGKTPLLRISEETCQSFRLKLASDSGGKLPAVSV